MLKEAGLHVCYRFETWTICLEFAAGPNACSRRGDPEGFSVELRDSSKIMETAASESEKERSRRRADPGPRLRSPQPLAPLPGGDSGYLLDTFPESAGDPFAPCLPRSLNAATFRCVNSDAAL